jgi:hypothetical protein
MIDTENGKKLLTASKAAKASAARDSDNSSIPQAHGKSTLHLSN